MYPENKLQVAGKTCHPTPDRGPLFERIENIRKTNEELHGAISRLSGRLECVTPSVEDINHDARFSPLPSPPPCCQMDESLVPLEEASRAAVERLEWILVRLKL